MPIATQELNQTEKAVNFDKHFFLKMKQPFMHARVFTSRLAYMPAILPIGFEMQIKPDVDANACFMPCQLLRACFDDLKISLAYQFCVAICLFNLLHLIYYYHSTTSTLLLQFSVKNKCSVEKCRVLHKMF